LQGLLTRCASGGAVLDLGSAALRSGKRASRFGRALPTPVHKHSSKARDETIWIEVQWARMTAPELKAVAARLEADWERRNSAVCSRTRGGYCFAVPTSPTADAGGVCVICPTRLGKNF